MQSGYNGTQTTKANDKTLDKTFDKTFDKTPHQGNNKRCNKNYTNGTFYSKPNEHVLSEYVQIQHLIQNEPGFEPVLTVSDILRIRTTWKNETNVDNIKTRIDQ